MRLTQIATYWAPKDRDQFGFTDFENPKTIDVQWQNKHTLYIDDMGVEQVAESVIYAEEDLKNEGYLFRGDINSPDPKSIEDARKIKSVYETNNFGNTRKVIKAWL